MKKSELKEIIKEVLQEQSQQPIKDFLNAHVEEVKRYLMYDRYSHLEEEDPEYWESFNDIEGFDEDGEGDMTPYPGEFGISINYTGELHPDDMVPVSEDSINTVIIAGRKLDFYGYNI